MTYLQKSPSDLVVSGVVHYDALIGGGRLGASVGPLCAADLNHKLQNPKNNEVVGSIPQLHKSWFLLTRL